MRKMLKYLCKVTSLGLQRFIVNRKNLAVVILFEVLDAIASIVFIEVLYSHIQSVAGYSKYEMYFLYGINLCQLKIMMMFCIGGIDNFSGKIISRDFDLILLKPINTRLMMMVPDTNIHQLMTMVAAVYMVVYGLIHCSFVIGLNVLFAVIAFALGTILVINFFSIIMPITFWVVNSSSLNDFVFTLHGNANYPKDVYPKAIKLILIFILPIILIANPTAMALFEKDKWQTFLILEFVYVIISAIVKRIIWALGIRKYQCTMQ